MQRLDSRLDNLEKSQRLVERPVVQWATPELCRFLAASTPEQLGQWAQNKETLDRLINAIREHVPNYALETTHAKP